MRFVHIATTLCLSLLAVFLLAVPVAAQSTSDFQYTRYHVHFKQGPKDIIPIVVEFGSKGMTAAGLSALAVPSQLAAVAANELLDSTKMFRTREEGDVKYGFKDTAYTFCKAKVEVVSEIPRGGKYRPRYTVQAVGSSEIYVSYWLKQQRRGKGKTSFDIYVDHILVKRELLEKYTTSGVCEPLDPKTNRRLLHVKS